MSILFDENNDYYLISDNPSMTLPDGDWIVGVLTRVTDNAGSRNQFLVSNNNVSVQSSFNLYLTEESETPSDTWSVRLRDDATEDLGNLAATDTVGADGVWRFVVAQRIGDDFKLFFCPVGGQATQQDSSTSATFTSIDGGDWYLGRRSDGNLNQWYGSYAGEFFKGNFSLSAAEITRLASGRERPFDVLRKLGKKPDCYLEMRSADYKLYDLSGNGNDATRQDAPVTKEHPIMSRRVWPVVAAPGQPMQLRGQAVPHIGRQWQPQRIGR